MVSYATDKWGPIITHFVEIELTYYIVNIYYKIPYRTVYAYTSLINLVQTYLHVYFIVMVYRS